MQVLYKLNLKIFILSYQITLLYQDKIKLSIIVLENNYLVNKMQKVTLVFKCQILKRINLCQKVKKFHI